MLTHNIVGTLVKGYVMLKDMKYEFDNGKILPYVYEDEGNYYCVRNGYIEVILPENVKWLGM